MQQPSEQGSQPVYDKALILIADDDLLMRQLLRQAMERQNHAVIEATDGIQALDLYQYYRPDLVLLDAVMPNMDGFTCCRQICSLEQPVPVLMITCLEDPAFIEQAFEAGATDFIPKPVNWAILQNRVNRLIQQSRLMRQVQQLNTELEYSYQGCALTMQEQTLQLHQSLEFEATLKRITDRVRDSLDEAQILQTVVQELALALRVSCCNISVYDLEQATAHVKYEYSTALVGYQDRIISMNEAPEIYQSLLQGQPVQFCSLSSEAWRDPANLFALPIKHEQTIGDIWLVCDTQRMLDDLELRLIHQVANQCAIALRQARLYEASQAQVKELQKLSQMKDDFLSSVSHELRSPITSIKVVTRLLATVANPDNLSLTDPEERANKIVQYLQILQEECDRELNLIQDLLDLQQLSAGVHPLDVSIIDLNQWIPAAIEPMSARIHNHHQTLEIHLAPFLPSIITDAFALKRMLIELINNAWKYTPPDEFITVTGHLLHNTLYLQVTNTGVEIPAPEITRIFDKFYRIPNGDPWARGGTGLGLALVKKLVEHLNGSITVSSETNKTCFTLALPVALQEEQAVLEL